MVQDLNFETNSFFKSVLYDLDAESWSFIFENEIGLVASGFWRLLENNQIVLVSQDHGQLFGLPKPVDLVELFSDRLLNKKLTKIQVKKDTADLILFFGDQYKLEVYIASTGYETYNFSFGGKSYIGLGSGEIAIY